MLIETLSICGEALPAGGHTVHVGSAYHAHAVSGDVWVDGSPGLVLDCGRGFQAEGVCGLWNYIARVALDDLPASPLIFEIEASVESGRLGFMICKRGAPDPDHFEQHLSAGPKSTVRIELAAPGPEMELIVRNTDLEGDGRFRVIVHSLRAFPAKPLETSAVAKLKDAKHLSVNWLAECLGEDNIEPSGGATSDAISVITAEAFGERCGVSLQSSDTPYWHWKMERDDAPILAALYHSVQPTRHLEFGTWRGFGTKLCLENSHAHVWTINLPSGEKTEGGQSVYGDNTDADSEIGLLYRQAGLSSRVTQILADSLLWTGEEFSDGFFDSILIDGGHSCDVVVNDTEKAVRLLRPGGYCIWHDFCPDPRAVASNEATQGVARAIHTLLPGLGEIFEDLVWIQPSYLLVGRRKQA